jgi:hypothetical protein
MSVRRFDKPPASAAVLQFHYEQAIKARDARQLPKSTADALDYLLKQNDLARLQEFMSGRPAGEAGKILTYIERHQHND